MINKSICVFVCMLLIATTILPITGSKYNKRESFEEIKNINGYVLSNDLLIPPDIFYRKTVNIGPGPGFYDTSEYMMGSISVGVFLLESDGSNETSTETWTATEENQVTNEIQAALNWWAQQDANAGVSFVYDWHYAVQISIEPINHPSVFTNSSWEEIWVTEAMATIGYTSGDRFARTRAYINDLRIANNSDWGFAVFVVDSSNDLDGCFSDASPPSFLPCAWGYLGGPFVVMTYDNDGWGIGNMDQVMAHETGHIFYATDEYNGYTEYSGYLNAADVEGSGCVMDTTNLCLSSGTRLQIGWRDTDIDGIHDILDTFPETTLIPYSPDPTNDDTPTYNGSATVVPYTNNNPNGPKNDVSINTIDSVQYRVDGGLWLNTTATDGTFDEYEEDFTFTTTSLSHGQHTIEAFTKNSVGNIDASPASDIITIDVEPDKPTKPTGDAQGKPGESYAYSSSSNDPDGDKVKYGWDWDGNSVVDEWDDNDGNYYTSGVTVTTYHSWNTQGTYNIKVKAQDTYGVDSVWSDPLEVEIPKNKSFKFNSFFLRFQEQQPHLFPIIRQLLGL